MEENRIEEFKRNFRRIVDMSMTQGFYADINYFAKSETRVNLDKTNTNISKDNDVGIKIRIWDTEKFLEHAQTSLEFADIEKSMRFLIEKAKSNISQIVEKKELILDKEKIDKNFFCDANLFTKNLILEEKTKKLAEFRNRILDYDSDVVNVRIVLIEEEEENIFVNSYKSLYQRVPIYIFVMVAFVKAYDGSMRTVYDSFVDNGLEVFKKAEDKFEIFTKMIESMKKAKKLEGGKYKAILAPKLTGLLAHESFGHGMEADTMMKGRALASKWIKKKIGADFVNIVDFPAIEGKHGQFYFDHEGNLARKTYLVKNGIISEPMADVYSKTRLNLKNSSNSRFESFDHKHYVRMSNTYFEAGEKSFEELISGVEDGIYIISSSGGMEDPKSWGVQIQGNFGQKIRNGKLVDEFYDGFALTGFLPDIVKNISGISKEFEIEGGGSCGKGHKEWVRVAEGGPYMLIDEVILG